MRAGKRSQMEMMTTVMARQERKRMTRMMRMMRMIRTMWMAWSGAQEVTQSEKQAVLVGGWHLKHEV